MSYLALLAGVIFLDLTLSGDNAVVIAMVAGGLKKEQQKLALSVGMLGAAVLRIVFALFAVALLYYRWLALLGGLALLWIAYKLFRDIWSKENGEKKVSQSRSLGSAIGMIIAADVSMSLDNVLAVASFARQSPLIMAIGILASIAMLTVAAKVTVGLMERWRWLNWAGVALIVWVAFDLILGAWPR
jgi:YjbE family integral membrane protein